MNKCVPTYWFLAASDQGTYVDRLGKKDATIPKSQLLDGRAAGWTAQNQARWKIADPKFMLSDYTSGNRVTALVDGEAYVKSLAADLSAQIKDGSDFVLMAGWQFSNDFNMAAGDQATTATQLSEIIRLIAARNNTTRALVMKLPVPLPQNGPTTGTIVQQDDWQYADGPVTPVYQWEHAPGDQLTGPQATADSIRSTIDADGPEHARARLLAALGIETPIAVEPSIADEFITT